ITEDHPEPLHRDFMGGNPLVKQKAMLRELLEISQLKQAESRMIAASMPAAKSWVVADKVELMKQHDVMNKKLEDLQKQHDDAKDTRNADAITKNTDWDTKKTEIETNPDLDEAAKKTKLDELKQERKDLEDGNKQAEEDAQVEMTDAMM